MAYTWGDTNHFPTGMILQVVIALARYGRVCPIETGEGMSYLARLAAKSHVEKRGAFFFEKRSRVGWQYGLSGQDYDVVVVVLLLLFLLLLLKRVFFWIPSLRELIRQQFGGLHGWWSNLLPSFFFFFFFFSRHHFHQETWVPDVFSQPPSTTIHRAFRSQQWSKTKAPK